MTLDIFFEKFELIAEAPDAPTRMRELILESALSGSLDLQNDNDESADALYQRIADTFRKLEQEKSIRKRKALKPLGETDSLPRTAPHWRLVRLGEVVDYGSAAKVESDNIPNDAWLLDLEDIEKTTSKLLKKKPFSESPSKSTKSSFSKGDVLYGKLRPYLDKVLVADDDGFCTTEIIPIRTFGLIDPFFLRLALKRPSFIAYTVEKSYGMNLPLLGTEDARNALFPLPPLAEQKRIVAKVDELMALCDQLEAQQQEREQQRAQLNRAALARFSTQPTVSNLNYIFHKSYHIPPTDLRKTILTLAVQGKLVRQDPNESAPTDFPGWVSKAKSSKDSSAPATWLSIPLGKLGEWRGGGTPSKSNAAYWDGTIPWVCPKDMKRPLISESIDQITEQAIKGSSAKLIPPGSLLMVVRGMILIRAFPVALSGCEVTVNQDMKSLIPEYPESKDYLLHCLQALEPDFLQAVERSSHGTCKLLTKDLHGMLIPIPPADEQRRIVAKVDQLMALVDQLEAQLEQSRSTATSLLNALVSELSSNDQLDVVRC